MTEVFYQQATAVRNDFSTVMDKAIYEKPQLISRTKDQLVLIGTDMLNTILQSATVHVGIEPGDDGRHGRNFCVSDIRQRSRMAL